MAARRDALALPAASGRHATQLEVRNETGYDGRALRRILVRLLRERGLRVTGVVRVRYAPALGTRASLGEVRRTPYGERGWRSYQGLRMAVAVPPAGMLDVPELVRLLRLAVHHWAGASNDDLPDSVLRAPAPAWAAAEAVPHTERVTLVRPGRKLQDPTVAKLARARKALAQAEAQERRAAKLVAKWRRRLAALERAELRRAAKEAAHAG